MTTSPKRPVALGGPPLPGHLSRRRFLKLAGAGLTVAGAGSVLAACGGDSAATTLATGTGQTTAASSTSQAGGQVGGSLQFLSWEGYDLRGCMDEWEAANGVTMESTYIADYPEVPAKLSAAGDQLYDLTTYYNGFASLYIEELELVSPLDRAQIPNWDAMAPFFQEGRWWTDGTTTWGVPWSFGVEGCCYKADEVDPPESWLDLLKPEFKDRLAIVDDNIGNYYIGAQILGFADDLPNLSNEQLDEILDLFGEFRANARTIAFYGDLAELFAAGEIVASIPGWGAVNVWSAERGAQVEMNIPKEGAFTFIEAFAMPEGSDNPATVHAWMNQALSPEVQACAAASLAGGVVNPAALALLETDHPEIAALYDYENLDQLFEVAPVFDLPDEGGDGPKYSDWISKWETFKASA